jgi:ectoine hydroxylase-related dioxygenase (phytanoyl-CoA dioxygenase family)
VAVLSQGQVYSFNENGFLIVRKLVDPETVSVLREALMRIVDGKHEGMRRRMDLSSADGRKITKIERFWNLDPVFEDFLRTSKLGEAAGQLMDTPEVRLFYDQMFYKEPKVGAPVPCHQDYDTFRDVSTSNLVTGWIATSRVDRENGCMYMIPGSHKWGLIDRIGSYILKDPDPEYFLSHSLAAERQAQIVRQPIELDAGDVSFHHALTIHCSYPNISDRPRLGYIHHYLSADARYVEAQDLHKHHEIEVKDGELLNSARFPVVWRDPVSVSQ